MKTFKLFDLSQLFIDVLILKFLVLNVVFNYVLIPEDSELLLDRRLLFLGHIQLMKSGMDVSHH
jgi:hypothetical protein